jgi:hypothetical protein
LKHIVLFKVRSATTCQGDGGVQAAVEDKTGTSTHTRIDDAIFV